MNTLGYIGLWEALLLLTFLAIVGGVVLCVLILVLRKGKPRPQTPPMIPTAPVIAPNSSVGESLESRLARLSDLKQKQLISEEEFNSKRQQLLQEL